MRGLGYGRAALGHKGIQIKPHRPCDMQQETEGSLADAWRVAIGIAKALKQDWDWLFET